MTRLIKQVPLMKKLCADARRRGLKLGLVPTMGYLHEGHMSLIKEALKRNDIVVVSIFVNPAQFGPKEDLNKYPRDLKRDMKMISKLGVDAVFYPNASDMYPEGYRTFIEIKCMSDVLCGASRPGHFAGVATIVAKLFNIVGPDNAYFGEKDLQQLVLIKRMAKDLNMGVNVVGMPIIREADGLAMSSRNSYLSKDERKKATVISRALMFAKGMAGSGVKDAKRIRGAIEKTIKVYKDIRIDYISVVDPETLEEKKTVRGRTIIAVAAYVGKTRLIDNIEVGK